MNKLTIQINSLEALERLIGGDSEIEIDVRNSVIQKFANKHLKALANTNAITQTLSKIQREISDEVSRRCSAEIATFKKNYYGAINEVKLNPAIESEISRKVRTLTDTAIQKAVDEAVEVWADEQGIKRRINAKFDHYTQDFIKAEVRAKLDALKAKL